MTMLSGMANVRIDDSGELRCWKCGSKNLETRRKTGGKVIGGAVGVVIAGPIGAAAALAAKKRIRCVGCGEYNDAGNPEPWTTAGTPYVPPPKLTFTERVQQQTERDRAKLEEMRSAKEAINAIKAAGKAQKAAEKAQKAADKQAAKDARRNPPQPAQVTGATPANWYPNPDGTPSLRWWDGHNWTDHIRQETN